MNHPITPEDERKLRHMLGIDDMSKRDPKPYRNYYCAGGKDVAALESLRERGLVEKRSNGGALSGGDPVYTATEEGIRVAKESQRRGMLSKGKRLYLRFLRASDCCPDLTFKTFLTSPDWAETRKSA